MTEKISFKMGKKRECAGPPWSQGAPPPWLSGGTPHTLSFFKPILNESFSLIFSPILLTFLYKYNEITVIYFKIHKNPDYFEIRNILFQKWTFYCLAVTFYCLTIIVSWLSTPQQTLTFPYGQFFAVFPGVKNCDFFGPSFHLFLKCRLIKSRF